MPRTDELGNLTLVEQEALKTLAARLLRADLASAAEAMARITLLWLDWMDRWEGRASEPMRCETDEVQHQAIASAGKSRSVAPDEEAYDPEVHHALAVLRSSYCRLAVCEFLLDLARTNGITDSERRYLSFVRSRLESAGHAGPYR
jgi:hypothetical protein